MRWWLWPEERRALPIPETTLIFAGGSPLLVAKSPNLPQARFSSRELNLVC
jgi:hypothetical protein